MQSRQQPFQGPNAENRMTIRKIVKKPENKSVSRLLKWLKFLLTGLMLFSCAKEKKTVPLSQQIIAQVGDRVITAEEFKYSYEFSFAPLRHGANPRRAYLDYMIKELLLANEGYRLGYNKTHYVSSRVANRRRDDLLEAFYIKYVHRRVKIPEEELQEAIKKGTVKWRMLIWPAPSLEEARKVLAIARKTDLKDFIAKQTAKDETLTKAKKQFETDWVDFLDLQPEAFDRVKDLEIGQVSEPIPYGNGYALVQVTDINREAIKESELQAGAKRKQMYGRLHDIQADRIVHAMMDSMLTPLDVRVKGGVVEAIAPALYQWVQEGLPEKSLLVAVRSASDTAKSHIKLLKEFMDETLLTFRGGNKTVKDYLAFMNYYRSPLKQSGSFGVFKERLITEIGAMFKNEQFIDMAERDGFADSAQVVADLRIWEQKWTYDVTRANLVKDLKASEQELHDFFKTKWRELEIADVDSTRFYKYENQIHNLILHEKHLARLNQRLAELEKKYPVQINNKLLEALPLSDSLQTNQTSLFVRKNFTGQALVPVVDMKWLRF